MILSLLVREVQNKLADKKLKSRKALAQGIDKTLNLWIRANGLHPERVKVMNVREFRHWLQKIEREEAEAVQKAKKPPHN